MDRADGIDVATEDQAAWDAAVAAFKKARLRRIGKPAVSPDGDDLGGPVEVLGARELGLQGSGAVLT